MTLKIAVWHDPPSGGAQRSLSEMLSRLAKRGHRVDVFRLGHANQDSTSEAAYGVKTEVIPFELTPHLRKGMYLNDWRTWRDWQREEAVERNLAERIDSAGYDVVFVSVLRQGIAPSLLRFSRTPTVYFCHEPPRRFYEPWCRPEAAPLSPFERARLAWRWPSQRLLDVRAQAQDSASVRAATTVLTNSRYTQRRVQEVYGRDADVCYLGVNAEAFAPSSQAAKPGLVSVGALEAHKGFDFLLEAVSRISSDIRPPLTIVGSHGHPRMRQHLQQMARRLQVQLTIVSGLSDTELATLYASSTAFLFGARMEPFGLVLLEAMASGLPIIAVAEGGVPEIVQDGITGFLCQRDPGAFADRAAEVISDTALRHRMASAARENAETDWLWDATVTRLERHLHATASTAASGRQLS